MDAYKFSHILYDWLAMLEIKLEYEIIYGNVIEIDKPHIRDDLGMGITKLKNRKSVSFYALCAHEIEKF